jgi:hypothetical protein
VQLLTGFGQEHPRGGLEDAIEQLELVLDALTMGAQRCDGECVECHGATTSTGLRVFGVDLVARGDDALAYRQSPGVEVDVAPTEAGDLAASHPSRQQEEPGGPEAVVGGAGEELGRLGGGPHVGLGLRDLRTGRASVGVLLEDAHPHRVLKGTVDERVGVLDALGREAAVAPGAVFPQLGVEVAQDLGGQRVEADRADAGDHPVPRHVGVAPHVVGERLGGWFATSHSSRNSWRVWRPARPGGAASLVASSSLSAASASRRVRKPLPRR